MTEKKTKFDLQEYWVLFLRRKWFFIIPLMLIYAGFLISSYVLPRVYQATAIILIEEKKVVNPLLKNLAVSTPVTARLNSLREEILAWPRLFQLVEKLELNKDMRSPLELERLIVGIRRNIKLGMKSREVLMISYQGQEPKGTQDLVNTLCDILIQRNISSQLEDTESAITFINQQLVIYKKKLDESGEELRKFNEIYGLGILSESKTNNPGQANNSTLSENVSPAGLTLNTINTELAALEAELVMASIDCTEKHPRIKAINTKIGSLTEKRSQYIKQVSEKVGVDAQAYINIAVSFPRRQEELARLTRGKAINEKIYAMLLERLETAEITERLDNSENKTKFRIIEPARLPLSPIKPNKLKINFLGIILGAMAGAGFIYLLEYTDTSFKTADELKNFFDTPVLGSISEIVTEDDLKKRADSRIKILFIIGSIISLTLIAIFVIPKINFRSIILQIADLIH